MNQSPIACRRPRGVSGHDANPKIITRATTLAASGLTARSHQTATKAVNQLLSVWSYYGIDGTQRCISHWSSPVLQYDHPSNFISGALSTHHPFKCGGGLLPQADRISIPPTVLQAQSDKFNRN
jgi:hypothetical protein